LCKNIVLPSQSEHELIAVQNLVNLLYTIFRETRNLRNLNPRFLTVHAENITMILHMQKRYFSAPRVFLPIKIGNNYIIKAFLSIVLKTHGAKPRTWRIIFASKHR